MYVYLVRATVACVHVRVNVLQTAWSVRRAIITMHSVVHQGSNCISQCKRRGKNRKLKCSAIQWASIERYIVDLHGALVPLHVYGQAQSDDAKHGLVRGQAQSDDDRRALIETRRGNIVSPFTQRPN